MGDVQHFSEQPVLGFNHVSNRENGNFISDCFCCSMARKTPFPIASTNTTK